MVNKREDSENESGLVDFGTMLVAVRSWGRRRTKILGGGHQFLSDLLTDAWKMPAEKNSVLGSRVMILSAADPFSQESAQRMWFELQKIGIQG